MKYVFFLGALLFILTPRDVYSRPSRSGTFAASETLSVQMHWPWLVRGELGQVEIHHAERRSMGFGLRLGRNFDRQGFACLDLGLSVSTADEAYLSLDAGVELRPMPRSRVTPFLGARAGFIGESEFSGIVLQGGAGLHCTLTPRAGLRLAIYRGTHGGQMGPHLLTGGVEVRF